MRLDAGSRLGPDEVIAQIGAGGMGEVYSANDTRLGRTVALKVLPTELAHDPERRERFEREARAIAALNHPNICTLHDIGHETPRTGDANRTPADAGDPVDFLVFEHLTGETLAARLTRGPLPRREALDAMVTLLRTLEVFHAHGFMHRDLKPANIFLTDAGLKLLDFGVARSLAQNDEPAATALTLDGAILGTPGYIAPEALSGDPVDARADLFAAGALLYEMLSGRPPFVGTSVIQVLHGVMHDAPPVVNKTGTGTLTPDDRVIHRALAKKPNDRYPSAAAMAADVEALLVSSPARPVEPAFTPTRLIVMPFQILRSDPDTDFLAVSLPDEVTTSLLGLGSLIVRSNTTVARISRDGWDLESDWPYLAY